jgi:hypothetical protein
VRWQASLADLSFVVLAAGLGISIARGAREIWGMRGTGAARAPVPFARTAGVATAVVAVWPALMLARRTVAIARERARAGGPTGWVGLAAAAGWRVAAAALLLVLALRESWILRVDYRAFESRASSEIGWDQWYELRQALTPVCATLVILGLMLGMGGGRLLLEVAGTSRQRPYWLFVPLAALAGLLFMSLPNGWLSVITQLVLVALEAVHNAMPPPYRAGRDGLSVRLLRAGIETVPAMLAGLWLALLVARDFEMQRWARPWAATRGGWLLRIASFAAAVATAAIVVLVAMPTVTPHWVAGYRHVLEPEIVLMVLAGFGAFAAGLAARALAPPQVGPENRRMARIAAVATPSLLLMIVLLSALQCLPASSQLDPWLPAVVGRICDIAREIPTWLGGLMPDYGDTNLFAWFGPERLAWAMAMGAVGLLVLELAAAGAPGRGNAPFDTVCDSPGRAARFTWLTTALTAVCVVAMPTLLVIGQVIVHIRLHIDNWMRDGWPSPF